MSKRNVSPQRQNRAPDQGAKRRSIKRSGMGCSLVLALLLLALGAGVVVGVPRLLALVNQTGGSPLPVTDRTSPQELATRLNQEIAQLNGYGWVDQAAGVARIPIDRAIALLSEKGLPVGDPSPVAGTSTTTASVAVANINYQDHILPIFERSCGECHGADDPEDGLQLTTYKGVMAGSIYGSVIKPGDPDNSYLVEMVVTGQMPKKGPNLTPAEIDLIVGWIMAGAPEQGAVVTDTIATGPAADTTAADPAAAETTVDLENVSFQKDVLPILEARCAECHGLDEPEEGLVLTSYRDVMLGSIYGSVVKPGDPENSYLVEMITTGQMPKKGDDLTKEQIDTIVAWIQAGAPDN